MQRKHLLWSVSCIPLAVLLSSCAQSEDNTGTNSIVLYSSVDDYVLAQAVEAFEADTGIRVRVVGDTEATKTTGLVTRLLAEHESKTQTADVWWSSEPFGSVRLAESGVLAEYKSKAAEQAFEGGWPGALVSETGMWYGHALRARVIVYSTDRAPNPPTTVRELAEPKWKGRIGIARPRFGTTRGHMAALVESWGANAFEAWIRGLKANGVRVYDSNSSVVRAIWMGEIDAGLTDTDDVLVGQSRGWAVGMNTPSVEDERLVVPCSIGLVVGGTNPEGARAFIDWVIGGPGEHVLQLSESRNRPVNPAVTEHDRSALIILIPSEPSGHYERIAARVPEAMEICGRVLP